MRRRMAAEGVSGSWRSVNSGLGSLQIRALDVDPQRHDRVYAGTSGRGVYVSGDGGASWEVWNEGLGNLWVKALAMDVSSCDVLYAGTNDGVWERAV